VRRCLRRLSSRTRKRRAAGRSPATTSTMLERTGRRDRRRASHGCQTTPATAAARLRRGDDQRGHAEHEDCESNHGAIRRDAQETGVEAGRAGPIPPSTARRGVADIECIAERDEAHISRIVGRACARPETIQDVSFAPSARRHAFDRAAGDRAATNCRTIARRRHFSAGVRAIKRVVRSVFAGWRSAGAGIQAWRHRAEIAFTAAPAGIEHTRLAGRAEVVPNLRLARRLRGLR